MPEEAIQEVTQPEIMPPMPEIKFSSSASIGKLVGALAKAQLGFKAIKKDTSNPYYGSKYADLAGAIEATQPSLAKNGLVVIQLPRTNIAAKTQTLNTILLHESGEWISGELEVPATMMGKDRSIKFDVQSVGAAMTYCRRYSYQAIIGVAAEADDDGNTLSRKALETADEYDQRTEDQKIVMPAQAQAMHEAMKRSGKSEALVSGYLKEKGYKQFEQVLRSDFQIVLKWLNTAQKASGADLTPDLEKSVREATNKKLWALAAEKGIPEGDIKTYAYEKFKVDSMTRLAPEQLKDVVEWVKLL